jgi:4-hydroxy-tetrahydrodipicolinate reductase
MLASVGHRRHEAAMAGNGKVRIQVLGSGGRMGRAIASAATGRDGLELVEDAPDVFVDFTAPEALEANLRLAVEARKPVLVGTTGLCDEHQRLVEEAAGKVAVIQAPNTSLGINLLRHLVEAAAARLGPDWDIEIAEMHHREKKDAPSGTALLLGMSAAKGRGSTLKALSRFDRMGGGEREPGTIGYASMRGGTVAGEHVVVFAGDGERIELGHRADSRMIFARGALRAALWLIGKPSGRYSMADVLGLE